jgi:hypothetical protein
MRPHRFLMLLPLLLFAIPARAQLQWDKPIQRFERSPDDHAIEARYTFRNAGAAPITIKSLRSSCGCTTAKLDRKTYAPGEAGEVVVKFTFGDRKGLYRKTVTVNTDEKTSEPVVLSLLVDIHEPLTIAPALVFWRTGEENLPKSVQIDAESAQHVHIKSVSSTNPRFIATLVAGKAGEHYAVAIAPTDTAQKDAAEVHVLTDFPTDAPRTYTIFARIK